MPRRTVSPLTPRRALAAGAVVSAVALWAAPAFSQSFCGDFESLKQRLETNAQEAIVARGLTPNGNALVVFASETGKFTIVMMRPDGFSCVKAYGEGWEGVKDATPAGEVM